MKFWLAFIPFTLLFLICASAQATITLDTHNSKQGTATCNVTSINLTLTSVTAGDLITCEATMGTPSSATTIAISDSTNGAYSVSAAIQANVNAEQYVAMFYFQNAAAGTYSVTATNNGAACYFGFSCQAWTGVAKTAALDTSFSQYKYQATSAANPTTGTALTPYTGGELIIGFVSTSNNTPTAGTNYTLIDAQSTCLAYPEYSIQNGPTATNAPFTMATDFWLDQMAAFKPIPRPTGFQIIQ